MKPPRPPDAWEVAVFDRATLFTAATMLGRSGRSRLEFPDPVAATEAAKDMPRTAVYAVDPNGRSIVLDRALWPMWLERWRAR